MAQKPKARSLKRVHVGSAPLSADLWQQIATWCDAPTWNCYGITETANWIGGAMWCAGTSDAFVGRPWGGTFAIRAEGGPVAEGEGEVLYRGPAVMAGYLDRAEATRDVLQEGWYATGDTGVLHNGELTLSGRQKEEINRAGIKVQPADVDRIIEAHASVAECCCFGAPDPIAGETVAAAVVAEPGQTPDSDVLRAFCADHLRPHAIPEKWFIVEAIPRTPRGKVSRAAVAEALL
jgi:acyl-CoA synthetase (AMP-forming)/AMP-acid ligase II